LFSFVSFGSIAGVPEARAQDAQRAAVSLPAVAGVPRLIRFSGTLKDHLGQPITETVGVTFALYKDPEGGAPLWLETQNLTPDAQGHCKSVCGDSKCSSRCGKESRGEAPGRTEVGPALAGPLAAAC
jgi:hypothetical protein